MSNKQINLKQNKRRKEGRSQALLMVNIQRAEMGDTITQLVCKGEGVTEREMKLEDQSKEKNK